MTYQKLYDTLEILHLRGKGHLIKVNHVKDANLSHAVSDLARHAFEKSGVSVIHNGAEPDGDMIKVRVDAVGERVFSNCSGSLESVIDLVVNVIVLEGLCTTLPIDEKGDWWWQAEILLEILSMLVLNT